jgi:hypothetical protein
MTNKKENMMEFLDESRDFDTVYSATLKYRYTQDGKFFNHGKKMINPDSGDVIGVPEEVITGPVVNDEVLEVVEQPKEEEKVEKKAEQKTLSDVIGRGRPSKRK